MNQSGSCSEWYVYKWADLFVTVQVTETRTGPLGCSNYDNLDSVSSVLVQSPENKVQLQGLSDFIFLKALFDLICVNNSCYVQFNNSPKPIYRLAADPPGLLERKFCAGCSQLHSLQWRGWIWLQGQWLLVQLWPQIPRMQLPLYGHPGHGGEPGEDHRDMGNPLQRVWGIR